MGNVKGAVKPLYSLLEAYDYDLAALFAEVKILKPTPTRPATRKRLRGKMLNNPITFLQRSIKVPTRLMSRVPAVSAAEIVGVIRLFLLSFGFVYV